MNRKLNTLLLGLLSLSASAEELSESELDTVVVTAPLSEKVADTARPVTVLTEKDLLKKTGNTIGATLQQEPGISSQSFGPGVGMPVIRGQTGPRVRVMQNGIGNNDVSNFSPDHPNSVEPVLAKRIEVLRGPATLLYGSGAIGGVVNVIDNRIPEEIPVSLFDAVAEQRFNSVSQESTSLLKFDGGKSGFAYHLDGFYRDRGNLSIGGPAIDETAARESDPALIGVPLHNTYGYIANTGAHAIGGSAGFSHVTEEGYLGAAINRLEDTYGIPPDGLDGPNIRIAMKQTKYDLRGEWKQPFELAETVRLKFGYTDYSHQELEGNLVGSTWKNQTYESRLELVHKPIGPVRGSIGFQSINSDFGAYGEETIVPQTNINTYGLFAVEALDIGSVTYELGARLEHTGLNPNIGLNRSFLPVSGSISALWKINSAHQMSLAFTQSQRAPLVQELYSNGFHDATRSFEIGNAHLQKEVSYNLDLGYRFKADWLRAELNFFQNWVNNYIYQQRTGQFDEETGFPVYLTSQANATFKGFEARFVVPVMENHYGLLDVTLFGDYTRGEFEQRGDVPRMPPLRLGFQLDYSKSAWSAYLRTLRALAQEHPGEFETQTAGYWLLSLGGQYQVKVKDKVDLTLFAQANNLLNENIRNSTSYLRNYAPEPGRGGEVGVRISY